MAGHVAKVENNRNGFKILIGETMGKIPLALGKCRWDLMLGWLGYCRYRESKR